MIYKICELCNKEFLGSDKENSSKICRSCVQKKANEKRKQTCIERYGVENIMKAPNAHELVKRGFERKYGEGIHSAMNVPEYREKFKRTCMERYGVPYYVMTKQYANNSHFKISNKNKEVAEWLNQNGYNCELEYTLDTKSYDIHIVGTNILIEIDPTYTHSTVPNHWSKKGIKETYHVEKSRIAENNGFRCIHIFDWDDWKPELKDIISNKAYNGLDDNIEIDRSKYFYNDFKNHGYKVVRFTSPSAVFSKDNSAITFNEWQKLSTKQRMQYLPVYDCGKVIMSKSYNGKMFDESDEVKNQSEIQEYEKYQKYKNQISRKCKYCDKEFIPKSNRQIYCKGPHYMTCPVCGKKYEVTNNEKLKNLPTACSYICRAELTRRTSISKYGCTAPGNNAAARKKAKDTMIKKYGVEYAMQSKEVRNKSMKTIIDRYGVDNVQKDPTIKQKSVRSLHLHNWQRKYVEIIPEHIGCNDMQVYILKDEYAEKFIRQYHKEVVIPAKLYMGLVKDDTVYRCISFNPVDNHRLIIVQDCSLPQYIVDKGDHKIFEELTLKYDVSEIGIDV